LAAALGLDPGAVLDLSASLNPFAPDVGELVGKHLDAVGRYPDPAMAARAMADALDADPEQVLLTNGGSEAISLVAAELGGRMTEPEFGLYPRGDQGPLWRSNPHNPSGRLAGAGERAEVWDEAFYPLATGQWTRGDIGRGAVVVGSLTKVFACPGLRLGYVLAADVELIRRVRRRQPEWSVNGLAAAVLPELLEECDLAAWSAAIARARRELAQVLAAHGFDPLPSDSPWVLVRAPGLRPRLARSGVLVRDCSSFGLPDHVRIAVPSPSGLARLDEALSQAAPR
jgi:histidinol-phosphate/aromatic aminotransferase/cobyric acid decarboxylase-like protein